MIVAWHEVAGKCRLGRPVGNSAKDFASATPAKKSSQKPPGVCLKDIFYVAEPYHTVPYGTDHGVARIQALRARLLSPVPYGTKSLISRFAINRVVRLVPEDGLQRLFLNLILIC
jgi:hypothetical protein